MKKEFDKMSEDKIDEVEMKGAYNAETILYMRNREQEIELLWYNILVTARPNKI